MAAFIFSEALRRLLVHEGGYTNHPSDPGGPTNFGITLADYRKYVQPNAMAEDIRAMARADAEAIYRSKYWDALRCDDLPAGVDYAVFDYGVNSGVGRAGKVLRRVLGLADGTYIVSDGVIVALRGGDPARVVTAICEERLVFLKRLKTWPVFGRGWDRRVAEVRAAAMAMAKSGAGGTSRMTQAAPGKGQAPVARKTRAAATGSLLAAGAATGEAARQAGSDIGIVTIIIGIAIAAAAVGWFAFHWRQRRIQDAPAATSSS